MRIRKREKISPIHVQAGDTISLNYEETDGIISREQTVLESKIGRSMEFTEAVVFDVEEGEFGENVKDGIGGAFLELR